MKAKGFHTIDELIAKAAKMGHNADEARKIIEKSYDYMKSVYREASLRELVHIAWVVY
jgi:hypothetical protein